MHPLLKGIFGFSIFENSEKKRWDGHTRVKNDVEIRCGHFQRIINNCILWNKLTKKYAYRSAFCVDHARIYIY